jgi:hypothetical protein
LVVSVFASGVAPGILGPYLALPNTTTCVWQPIGWRRLRAYVRLCKSATGHQQQGGGGGRQQQQELCVAERHAPAVHAITLAIALAFAQATKLSH